MEVKTSSAFIFSVLISLTSAQSNASKTDTKDDGYDKLTTIGKIPMLTTYHDDIGNYSKIEDYKNLTTFITKNTESLLIPPYPLNKTALKLYGKKYHDAVKVRHQVAIEAISELNELKHEMSLSFILNLGWNDTRMANIYRRTGGVFLKRRILGAKLSFEAVFGSKTVFLSRFWVKKRVFESFRLRNM